MAKYLSFGEAASRLGCDNQKVRQLVIEDKSLRATRITPNGLVLLECGLNGHFPYDLDFNSHLSSDGEITCDTYRLNAIGETEKTQTLFVGYLRVECAELQRFLSEQTLFTHDDDMLDAAALARLVAKANDAPPAPVSVQPPSGAIEQTQDPERRLARLRALGGSAKYKNGHWRFSGTSKLVTLERSDGRKRIDEKTIRADLREAAENERTARRAGLFDGLSGK
jgi:hypothetical protein